MVIWKEVMSAMDQILGYAGYAAAGIFIAVVLAGIVMDFFRPTKTS